MNRAVSLEWVRPPQQARSQQTLARLLDATEALLEDESVEEVTVAEIARRAGSSVGSFYGRFTDKEALLRCVFERFHEQAAATAQMVLEPERWHGVSIREALDTMLRFMLRVVQERRGLLVALLTRASRDPDLSALGQRLHVHISDRLKALVKARNETVNHPDPDAAIALAVWMVLSSLEVRTLYRGRNAAARADGSAIDRLSDEVLARELSRMCMRYLGIVGDER